MLTELRVQNLGVIADLAVVFSDGMTAVTGETGTGKTLMIEAIELLVGARADSALVRSGESEARVEARFSVDGDLAARIALIEGVEPSDLEPGELIVARVVPSEGRSRAYCNGRLVTVGFLADLGRELVDLQGQHAHHLLLAPTAQRRALDAYAGRDASDALASYREARARARDLEEHLASLGGDDRERAREADLLRFQVEEIDAAGIEGPDEEARLIDEERRLGELESLGEGASDAQSALEGTALDAIGQAVKALQDFDTFNDETERLRVLQDEISDVIRSVRGRIDALDDDPERLDVIGSRRKTLGELRRKYGDSLADVLAYRDEVAARLHDLATAEERAAEIEGELEQALRDAAVASRRLTDARRDAAARLAPEIEAVLHDLAMPAARIEVDVGAREVESGGIGSAADLPADGLDEVTILLAANAGERLQPLARVASGGELARTMLAARVVLTHAPPTLVFDEVDAGIGGQAGVAVGKKLALVARRHQVLCVTHLAQVAAFADQQIVVDKSEREGRTVVTASVLDDGGRVDELSRMLSGTDTDRARGHAEELLVSAAQERRT